MFSVSTSVNVGGVQVLTSDHGGLPVEALAKKVADRIVSVGDKSLPVIQQQAQAFKAQVEAAVLRGMQEVVEQERLTIAAKLRHAGYSDLVYLLEV